MPLRIAVDATPLLGRRTGVGRYVDRLLDALAADGLDLTLTAFTVRGAASLRSVAPAGARVVHRPAPARALQCLWGRGPLPPVELLAGRCDVFHATNFVLPPSRRAAGVVTVHDLTFLLHPDVVTPAVERYRRLVPRSIERAELVLCPSHAVADELSAHLGLEPDRVRVTPLGVDPVWRSTVPPTAAQLEARGLPARYLLFVGTREPRKELATLVAAHEAAQAAEPDVPPLVVAGPAGWGADLVLSAGVVATGWLGDDALRGVVSAATALVLPSRYEGFGLPLLEALACGIPCVASDLPVHREVAGDLATFVPVRDVDALAHALVTVSTSTPTPSQVAARRSWAARWTWPDCARRTAAAYRDAAARVSV